MKVCSYRYFRCCGYFRGPWVSIVTTDYFSVKVTRINSRTGVSWTHRLSLFDLFLTQWIMAILSKGCKPDNFELHNSLKLSKSLFQFCWMWIFPWIKLSWHSCSVWDKPGWLNWFWQFLCEGLSSFNPKGLNYSYAWSRSLCEGKTSFCTGFISKKLCKFLLMFFIGFTSLSVLLLFLQSITFFVFTHGLWFYFI